MVMRFSFFFSIRKDLIYLKKRRKYKSRKIGNYICIKVKDNILGMNERVRVGVIFFFFKKKKKKKKKRG
jgi:hypothetical protein